MDNNNNLGGIPGMNSIGGLPVDNGGGLKNVGFGQPQKKSGGSPMIFVAVGAVVIALVCGVMAIMFYGNMTKAQNTVDETVDAAVAKAVEEQKAADWEACEDSKRQVVYRFKGPVDYGSLSFDYRRDWSVYWAKTPTETKQGDFEAYLHLRTVPPGTTQNSKTKFALRVFIIDKQFPTVYQSYKSKVDKGDLKESRFDFVAGQHESGLRLDGMLDKETEVHMVIFKLRDKTAVLRTDGSEFLTDFETILATLDYIE